MFVCIDRQKEQKELYFSLDNLFALDYGKRKIRGIYVIFKDAICMYVGQSGNVASRLATHLSGKYENADKLLIFEDSGEVENLTPSEKYAIQLFKPIENILADYSEKISVNDLIDRFFDYEKSGRLFYSYEIMINSSQVFLCNSESFVDFLSFKAMQDCLKEHLEFANE